MFNKKRIEMLEYKVEEQKRTIGELIDRVHTIEGRYTGIIDKLMEKVYEDSSKIDELRIDVDQLIDNDKSNG